MSNYGLVKLSPGRYETTDGRFQIEQGWGDIVCDNPHPMRTGGFCPGQCSHPSRLWQVFEIDDSGTTGVDVLEAFPTLRQAAGYVKQP